MKRNVAGQKVRMLVIDTATNLPKTGDAANLTCYVSKDFGTVTALTDTSATEVDATNSKGEYDFDVSQTETNAHQLHFSGKSSTSGVIMVPKGVTTEPEYFSIMGVDSSGNVTLANNSITSAKLGVDCIWLSQPAYGTCQSGSTANDIKLAAGASSVDNHHAGGTFLITGGTGLGQAARYCTAYNGTTKVASIVPAWTTTPDDTTTYMFLRWGTGAATNAEGAALATQASVDAIDDYIDTEISAIKAKTDLIDNLYTAQIDFQKDAANTRDEYSVTWLKNGVPQTSGITSPTIQVVKRDATNLIASTSMTNSGSGVLIYNEATNRTTDGESYKVITVATIDSASRTFAKWIGRDDV